ncbi:phosphonoacetaldehyde hydrolase [Halomonas marinisediminis]|uniref:Phosphonoacetaldehyde hydrolase n=1 Tax=Halomonas marinisediminis TaxID=2546095 RepID=A0ABY2DB37_9GAMM|nr:phosphonoacetaldehyde hydrolase [Halomonas marinisediminis]TDB02261.1 phosphonoacetaldehyde hydrolase [Halomonas marinisediminis]
MKYQNPKSVQAVVLDWAGTVVDFGSFAPTQIFVEAFSEFNVEVTLEEARGPMGMGKWDHIRTLCNENAIANRFKEEFGRLPTDEDVTTIYNRFMPLQISKIGEHSEIIPGALDVINDLRKNGVKIGSCSGYPAVVMEKVVEMAKENNYVADCVVATDEVPNGRPYPAQSLSNVMQLGVSDVAACVKVDDTTPGILEGRSAGMWTVALTCSGNALGVTYDEYVSMPKDLLAKEKKRVEELFKDSRPHYMIETINELPAVIADINARLEKGEMPQSF